MFLAQFWKLILNALYDIALSGIVSKSPNKPVTWDKWGEITHCMNCNTINQPSTILLYFVIVRILYNYPKYGRPISKREKEIYCFLSKSQSVQQFGFRTLLSVQKRNITLGIFSDPNNIFFMTWIRRCKEKTPISKISVNSNSTFTSYAWLCCVSLLHNYCANGWQLAKMKKSIIPDMSLPWNL